MIRVLDRLSNQKLPIERLPGHIVPGRYLLLDDTLVNNHSELLSRTVLVGDGSNTLKINESTFACPEQIEEDQQAAYKFISLAIAQIAQSFSGGRADALPSPLLPSQLFDDEGALNELEEVLADILEKGHLHEISRRPRFDIRYDELVQSVSRAKRLASSAHRHLAAHSACWQARTFTGIQPKKVLGLVSGDEYNLYENRVFARLVDRLERFLNKRLREIIELLQNLNDALDLKGSEKLDYRLSYSLYTLWGETFTAEAALLALDALETTRKELERLLKMVRGFAQSPLYKRIPRNAQVPSQLQATNILTHDQHYRNLLPLWKTLQAECKGDELTPAGILEHNQRLQDSYQQYCVLVVRRALKALHYTLDNTADEEGDCYSFSRQERKGRKGRTVQLQKTEAQGWKLTDALFESSITLVPVFTWDTGDLRVIRNKNSIVLPCCPYTESSPSLPSQWLSGEFSDPLMLSPMDFYVEERLIALLNHWLLSGPVHAYGQPVVKVPSVTMELLNGMEGVQPSAAAHAFRIIHAVAESDYSVLVDSLNQQNAQTCLKAVDKNWWVIRELTHCPVCNEMTELTPRDQSAFIGRCPDCELEWMIDRKEGRRFFKLSVNSDKANSFSASGRWFDQMTLSEH